MKIVYATRVFLRSTAGRATSASVIGLAAVAGAALLYFHTAHSPQASGGASIAPRLEVAEQPAPPSNRGATASAGMERMKIPADKARSMGIETAKVRRGDWGVRLRVTGRLELNRSRAAQVNPLVRGVVREVCVELGQTVQAGQILAYVDSREVGEAKLALVKDQLQLPSARKNSEWHTAIHQNTLTLLEMLGRGSSIDDIERAFRDRPVGAYREQIVSSLTRLKRTRADYERIRALGQSAVIPEKEVIRSEAEHEAAQAAHRALLEQTRFDTQHKALEAQQELQAAEAAVAISRSHLLILGYSPKDLESMDPLAEGPRIAYFPVRAPMAGTVIAKRVQLSMHVDHQTDLLQVADLSTVWLQADVAERDLGALGGLQGKQVAFRAGSYPDRPFTASVFSLGDLVDNDTRTVRLLALADNAQRLLKPGMFVDVELSPGDDPGVLQLPAAAVQRHHGATFVFLAAGDDFLRRDVRLGRSTSDSAEILSGVREGETVVVRGGFGLKTEMLSELLAE